MRGGGRDIVSLKVVSLELTSLEFSLEFSLSELPRSSVEEEVG
jgi:hypothetical protein